MNIKIYDMQWCRFNASDTGSLAVLLFIENCARFQNTRLVKAICVETKIGLH